MRARLNSNELKKKIQELLPNAGKIKRISKSRDEESGYIERVFSTEDETYPEVKVVSNITDQYLLVIDGQYCGGGALFEADTRKLYRGLPDEEKKALMSNLVAIVAQEITEDKDERHYKKIYIRIEHVNHTSLYSNDFDSEPLADIDLLSKLGRDHEDTDYSIENKPFAILNKVITDEEISAFGFEPDDFDRVSDSTYKEIEVSLRTDGNLDMSKVAKYLEENGLKFCNKRSQESIRGFVEDNIKCYLK